MVHLRPKLDIICKDLDSLFPRQEPNERVINAYFRLLERRSRYYTTLPITWAFDAKFLSDWNNTGFRAIRRRVGDNNILDANILLFPVFIREEENGHWALVVCRPGSKAIRAYDSLHAERTRQMELVFEFITRFAEDRNLLLNRSEWSFLNTPKSCPGSSNTRSTGIFLCAYADCLTQGSAVGRLKVDVRECRKKVAREIRRGRIADEEFLFDPPTLDEVIEEEWKPKEARQRVPQLQIKVSIPLTRIKIVKMGEDNQIKTDNNPIEETSPAKLGEDNPIIDRSRATPSTNQSANAVSPVLSIMADSDLEKEMELEEGKGSRKDYTEPTSLVEEAPTNQDWQEIRIVRMVNSPTIVDERVVSCGGEDTPRTSRNPRRNRGRKRPNKYFRVRRKRDDGTVYRVKLLKDQYRPYH